MATVLRGSDNFDSASGFNSVGTLKAWVNFNGQGTVAIRASGNVSSITDNSTSYTVNFTNAMPDVNYSVATSGEFVANYSGVMMRKYGTTTTTSVGVVGGTGNPTAMYLGAAYAGDYGIVNIAIFR